MHFKLVRILGKIQIRVYFAVYRRLHLLKISIYAQDINVAYVG